MALNAYSLCPAGTDKKIKFCCPDLASDLAKIEKMADGEQYQACKQLVDRLLQRHPDRACLLTARTFLLRTLGEFELLAETAATFLAKHPDNPIALAESAISAATTQNSREAMDLLQRAITASDDRIGSNVYTAMGAVAQRCLAEGEHQSARALLALQASVNPDDKTAGHAVSDLAKDHQVALLLKDEHQHSLCPEDVPWKPQFDEALSLATRGRVGEAAQTLTELATQVPDAPAIWRNLAQFRIWTADRDGAIEALEKFAVLDVPLEDAVEAFAISRLLSEDPLGDSCDVTDMVYRVGDVEHVLAVLSSSPLIAVVQGDLSRFTEEDEPPAKAALQFLDRNELKSVDEVTLEATPRTIGQSLLFGRQTDREARLEVLDVDSNHLPQVKALLSQLCGDELGSVLEEEVVEQESATERQLKFKWSFPQGIQLEKIRELVGERLDEMLLESWPASPLGILDGKSPQDAAGEDGYRIKVLAAILVVESWLERMVTQFDFNRLRNRLGLPTLGPIDPEQQPVENLPLLRFGGVDEKKLDRQGLIHCFGRAMFFGAREAIEKFAREVVARPEMESSQEFMGALAALPTLVEDLDQALAYLERGRSASLARKSSCAPWDLMEVPLRLRRKEPNETLRVMGHLQKAHFREPGVAEQLSHILMQLGVVGPDGRVREPAGPATEEQPTIVVPGQEADQPSELWTPQSEQSSGEKPNLWTPD